MPSPSPDGTEPQVPEQFRDTYRRAYQEALGTGAGTSLSPRSEVGHRAAATEYRTRARWGVPVAVAIAATVLILAAYLLGRMFADPAGSPDAGSATSPVTDPAPTSSTSPTPPAAAWSGAVTAVLPERVAARCTAKPGVDAAGRPVRYDAANAVDRQPATAWRCQGPAIGEELVFTLPTGTEIAEVGLIPGYAKTDATSGVDRYAENNRITAVTWILADGTEISQKFSADPRDRSLRTLRLPATIGDQITVRIDAVKKGKRNTTMISEARFAAPVR